jgi:hypothetical protein
MFDSIISIFIPSSDEITQLGCVGAIVTLLDRIFKLDPFHTSINARFPFLLTELKNDELIVQEHDDNDDDDDDDPTRIIG